MNDVRSKNVSVKYQRCTSSGCRDTGIKKSEFVAKTKLLYAILIDVDLQVDCNFTSKVKWVCVVCIQCGIVVLCDSLIIKLWKLIIKYLDSLDFKVSHLLGLWFYHTNLLILFCSPRHVHFWNATRLILFFLSNWQNTVLFVRSICSGIKCKIVPISQFYSSRFYIQISEWCCTVGQEYSVYVQGYTQSLYRENLQYPGDTSEILHVIPGRDCNRVQVKKYFLL